jgi:hypothetical protein
VCAKIERSGEILQKGVQDLQYSAAVHETNMRNAIIESTNLHVKMNTAAGDLRNVGYYADVRGELLAIVGSVSERLEAICALDRGVASAKGRKGVMPSRFELRYGILKISARQSVFSAQREHLSRKVKRLRERT